MTWNPAKPCSSKGCGSRSAWCAWTMTTSVRCTIPAPTSSSPPYAVVRELAIETVELFPTEMGLAIAPEQGTLMTLLTQLAGAASAIEIGTFTGYSSICIARGMAPGGHLLCCDISEEWTSVARKYWEKAGLSDRIELRLGPAIDTLRSLPVEEMFDLAFIDADKGGYLGRSEERRVGKECR